MNFTIKDEYLPFIVLISSVTGTSRRDETSYFTNKFQIMNFIGKKFIL